MKTYAHRRILISVAVIGREHYTTACARNPDRKSPRKRQNRGHP
jgi:hypothetical protein